MRLWEDTQAGPVETEMTDDEVRQRIRDFSDRARDAMRSADSYLVAINDLLSSEPISAAPHIQLRELWNTATKDTPLSACLRLTPGRITKVQARLAVIPLSDWPAIFARIVASRFCCGQNDRGWIASFDWILQPDTATKVMEGKYDDRQSHGTKVVGHAAPTAGKYATLFTADPTAE